MTTVNMFISLILTPDILEVDVGRISVPPALKAHVGEDFLYVLRR
jgi:hypothetical protein